MNNGGKLICNGDGGIACHPDSGQLIRHPNKVRVTWTGEWHLTNETWKLVYAGESPPTWVPITYHSDSQGILTFDVPEISENVYSVNVPGFIYVVSEEFPSGAYVGETLQVIFFSGLYRLVMAGTYNSRATLYGVYSQDGNDSYVVHGNIGGDPAFPTTSILTITLNNFTVSVIP